METEGIATEAVAAAVAAVIALAFSLALLERWLNSRKKHLFAWFVSMAIFAVASVALWVGASFDWTVPSYRIFYLSGGILAVPPLALGTLYLLGNEKVIDKVAIAIAAGSLFAIGFMAAAPTKGGVSPLGLPVAADVFYGFPRLMAFLASTLGALVVVAGAVWSLRKVEIQKNRRRAGGTSLVALGTIVLGSGGFFNSLAEEMEAFAISLAVGAALLFAGFLLSTTPPKAAPSPTLAGEDK